MAEKLFTEFPPVTTEQWEAVIQKDLKGADYEKRLVWRSPEGFNVRPYYRAENLQQMKHLESAPAQFPYVRGISKKNNWKVNQTINITDGVKAANAVALDILMKGVDSLTFKIDAKDGLSDNDLDTLLSGFELSSIETKFKPSCSAALKTVQQCVAKAKKDAWEANDVQIAIDFDPIRRYSLKGAFNPSNGNVFELIKQMISAASPLKKMKVFAVSPCIFHNSGATAVQELAFALAMGNEYLAQLTDLGLSVDEVATRMKFNFAVGSSYFMEIAKFRAARLLWANVVKAYGPKSACASKMRIHAVTSSWNQTEYDPYVNMLRGTTEAMSAALAGVDSLEVLPFDDAFNCASEFSDRMGRNTQLILKEEAYFDRVTDPSAGSYYIESLTESLASEAWKLFKEVEEKGGYLAAFNQGIIQSAIKASAAKRDLNIATRREILLGTNQYPNFTEKLNKGTKTSASCSCGCSAGQPSSTKIEVLVPYRGAQAFERLRKATEASGKPVKAFMLTFGNLSMARARAQFACNFFACAGFEVVDNNSFATVEEGVKAALAAGANIVVACSADDEYLDAVPKINQLIAKQAIVVVAGDPACKGDLEAKGINHFVNVRSNVLETLKGYQVELGINK